MTKDFLLREAPTSIFIDGLLLGNIERYEKLRTRELATSLSAFCQDINSIVLAYVGDKLATNYKTKC